MRKQMETVLLCLITFVRIQQTLSAVDGLMSTSETNKWTCTCSTADKGNLSFAVPASCFSSCNCDPATGSSSKNRWLCICMDDSLPKVAAGHNDTNCFSACTCSSGTSIETESAKKRISTKFVIIILLTCVTLTTIAFIASLLCYVYRRDKFPFQRPLFSPGEQTSCNSATSLISQGASSIAKYNVSASFPIKPTAGCFPKASILYRNKTGAIHGMMIEFSYSELENATNKFCDSNLIGVGGSSHVYRGYLKDGKVVAVKRIKTQGGPDAESAFLTEIELISRLHHCHVVPLLGYCLQRRGKYAERLLVFEYMSNGSLRDCLDGASGRFLDWGTRISIALGAARGLEYLHEAAAPRILHRDVKSTNVLLDENWRAKITDLGMAKHLHNEGIPSCSSSPARMQGTFGYFAPEYAIVGRASLKSDVFSFGVVLLELISGRLAIQNSANKGEESLVIWASPRLQDSRRVISELPDPCLRGSFDEEEMQVVAYLAKECLLLDPDSRPNMSEVVQILSTIATEKSKRKNMSLQVFQSSSSGVIKSEDLKGYDRQFFHPVETEDIKHLISDKQLVICSLPMDVSSSPCLEESKKEADTVSLEYIDKLTNLASNARSWHSQDDEAVDLTEPRFESFCISKC